MPAVPDRSTWNPVLDAYLHTGTNAVEAVVQLTSRMPPGQVPLAMDIETPGLTNNFTINCVTASWHIDGKLHTVLLDPLRTPGHREAVLTLADMAGPLIFHNAAFDVPALYHHKLIEADHINKITDTLVLARMAWPNPYDKTTGSKKLTDLAVRLLDMREHTGGMERAFKAAGYKTQQAGYEGMDIDSPIYRLGAMADTVATLLLEPVIRTACVRHLLGHPFPRYDEPDTIIATQETVNRVMLRRTARGIPVNRDYLASYREKVHYDRNNALDTLGKSGLAGGAGKGAALIEYLERQGQLPSGWPRTPTGKLKATKELLETLDHPLADAQRLLAETDKVLGYLDKVERQARITGHCHPQVGVLAASQTGRMSYSSPELQQFPEDARPILCQEDGQGLTSIDWSQIEPVTMGLLAQDEQFLAPFEAGEDLYGPIQTACGIDRKLAKVVLLATMYGQGTAGLAKRIGRTENDAAMIRRQMLNSMPRCGRWMSSVQATANEVGCIPTAAGRILPVDHGGSFKSVNYVVQGSAYDVLAHTICEMERQGIGDHIQLAMHDEVVVNTPAAEAVRRIMVTPPPFLTRLAGRTPTLRTDREDMGATWLKV